MRKSLLFKTAMALAVSVGSAWAADLPSVKAPAFLPPPPPPPLWTGFYVGLNAGYTWDDSSSVSIASATTPGLSPIIGLAASGRLPANVSGFVGGGQIGYNYQFGNNFLAGLEADIQGVAGSSGGSSAVTAIGTLTTTLTASKSLDYLGTVRGRLGYLVTPSLLLYGTGGLAYGQANASSGVVQTVAGAAVVAAVPLVGTGAASFSDTRVGWAAGGGVEWLFLPKWSAKVEYLYYDLGTVSAANALVYNNGVTAATTTTSTRFDGHVVRAGVNYHFNLFAPPAPVAAKY